MRRMIVIFLFISSTLPIASVRAADLFDYGSVEELKGVKRFYIDAGSDLDLRNIIKSRLEQLEGVKVVDRPEEAEH